MAYADIDGFRIDSVKYIDDGAIRFFSAVIHEFAQSIGKENFYLIGEIAADRINAFEIMERIGINAVIGIDNIADKLEYLVKGFRNPDDYFNLFRNSLLIGKDTHTWFKNRVITMIDDHDQIRKGNNKARFAYNEIPIQDNSKAVLNVLAMNAATMGIPCIYYGTEQSFDGHGNSDIFIREAMFGGEFGAFESKDRHFFNEESIGYKELAKILAIRKQKIELRRGRQYLRAISGDGINFGEPHIVSDQEIRSIIPWSRLFNNQEIILAINTDYNEAKSAWVNICNDLHDEGDVFQCIYSTDETKINEEVVVETRHGKSFLITIPPAGFVIFEKVKSSV
jgi:glycosidase